MPDNAATFLNDLSRRHKAAEQPPPSSRGAAKFLAHHGGFDGAKRDRLTQDWAPGNLGPNLLHRMDGDILRERARDLVLNNPLATSGIDAYTSNVVECGIRPKPLFDSAEDRRLWVAAWERWAESEADATGTQTLYELTALFLEEIVVAGGCLVSFHTLKRKPGRRIPLAIELIPEERFATDRDTYTGQRGGTQIIRGVEVDTATGKPVAYWIKPAADNDLVSTYADPIRIPADECLYAFFRRRIGQYRGYSLLAPVIMWLWKLGYYTDNEMMNSAVKSCYTAMIITQGGAEDFAGLAGDDDDTDADGNTIERMQPGTIFRGKPGEDIKAIGPNTPSSDAGQWIRLMARSVGIGMGISYEELMRDTGESTFSAIRANMNADRKRFRKMQKFVIAHFLAPAYTRFVRAAVLEGLDGFPSPAEYAANEDDYLAVQWLAPGWASVNPREDAEADALGIKNGTRTRAEIVGERGGDWDSTLEQLAREENKADELDLQLGDEPAPQQAALAGQGADDGR